MRASAARPSDRRAPLAAAPLPTLLLVMLALTVLTAPTLALAAPPDLQAHGSDENLWLVRVEKESAKADVEVSRIFLREKSAPKWTRLDSITARAISLGNKDAQLALLLSSGDWRLTTDSGFASGRSLPGSARVLTFGSDGPALWAVGLEPPASQVAPRRPTTTAAPARLGTARPPATAPAPSTNPVLTTAPTSTARARLVLFRLEPKGWLEHGQLPDGIVTEAPEISLGFAGGKALVAHRTGERSVRIHRHAGSGEWDLVADVEGSGALADFKLLSGTPSPTLWLRGTQGPPQLWIGAPVPAAPTATTTSSSKTEAMTTPMPGTSPVVRDLTEVPANAPTCIAYAKGDIKVLWIDGDKIFEQPRSAETGLPDGEIMSLPLPAISMIPTVYFWTQVALTIALVFALAASVRRRREMQEIDLDPAKLPLAPFSTRFIAGTIDALPLLAALWIANARVKDANDPQFLKILIAGVGVYLLLTTLVEALAGRSIGKMLTGLYVIGLDGRPASMGSRVTRNLLRVIDLPVMPLALVVFSPLRQRAGDLAAGTMVVRGKDIPEGVLKKKRRSMSDQSDDDQ